MMENKRPGRNPVRRDDIVGSIRKQILTGVYGPGQRLPPRIWFEEYFQTTPVTIQRAFQILMDEGVLYSAGRHGTFVSLRPPHLARYALLLYGRAEAPNCFCATLQRAVQKLRSRRNLRIDCIFGLDSGSEEDLEQIQRLSYQVENHLYAGIIFAANPFRLAHTPIVTFPGVPRVAFMTEQLYPQCTIFCPEEMELNRQALRYLADLGKHEVAALLPGFPERRRRLINFAEFGLNCRPEHLHFLPSPMSLLGESLIRLLWAPDRTRTPEAIFCGDDNLLPGVIRGLREALGDRAREIPIVSHANFPLAGEYDLPVQFFGYDLVAFLEQAIQVIDNQRAGQAVAPGRLPVTTAVAFQ